eukprot:618724_1
MEDSLFFFLENLATHAPIMGIKYLTSYLKENPTLRHEVCLKWNNKDGNVNPITEGNLIVWDCLGWIKRLYKSRHRNTKLLFDFKQLDMECRQLIETFKRFGFELIAFVDGYHSNDKTAEKRRRKLQSLKNIRKNIKILKQLHETDPKQRQSLVKKFEFVPSSGYSHYLEQALTHNGCKVFRGSSTHDIDKDIAQFVLNQKDRIYGIISVDTDYFGFFDLPAHCKLISEFHTKTKRAQGRNLSQQSLSLVYYYSSQVWDKLGLPSNDERLQLICLCGNDFVRKRPRDTILRRCGIDVGAPPTNAHHVNVLVHQQNDDTTNNAEAKETKEHDEEVAATTNNVNTSIKTEEIAANVNAPAPPMAECKTNGSLCEIISNAIRTNTIHGTIPIPDAVREFYSIQSNSPPSGDPNAFFSNINVSWHGLIKGKIFHGGFFFHDMNAVGFTIHEKLSKIRHALIHKHLELDNIDELIPHCLDVQRTDSDGVQIKEVSYELNGVNLKCIKHETCDLNLRLLTTHKNFDKANVHFVFRNTLDILFQRRWIDDIQHTALTLQFEVRFSLKRVFPGGRWPFYNEYMQFKRDGIPRVKDLTAQCLYWECARLICLSPENILPNICKLFDGPLFHFFCFQQANGDNQGICMDLMRTLKGYKEEYYTSKDRPRPNKRPRYNNHYQQNRSTTYHNNYNRNTYQNNQTRPQNHINYNQNMYQNNQTQPQSRHYVHPQQVHQYPLHNTNRYQYQPRVVNTHNPYLNANSHNSNANANYQYNVYQNHNNNSYNSNNNNCNTNNRFPAP